MQKLVIFGGTFNPIHYGHLHLVRQFAKIIETNQVLLIPTAKPPHKIVRDLASARDRLEMCRLAVKRDGFQISDMEIRRGGLSYTSDTLLQIKKSNPDCELYFVTGEDMFLTLPKWHEAKAIYSLATICAAPRTKQGCRTLNEFAKKIAGMGAKTMICDIGILPMSSTMIRNAVKKGKDISDYVPATVADYIHQHHLYLEEQNESGIV